MSRRSDNMKVTIEVPDDCEVQVVKRKPAAQAPVGSMPLLGEPACRHCGVAIYQPWNGSDQNGLTGWRHRDVKGGFYYNCNHTLESVAEKWNWKSYWRTFGKTQGRVDAENVKHPYTCGSIIVLFVSVKNQSDISPPLKGRLKSSEGMTEEIAILQLAACEGVTLSEYAKKKLKSYVKNGLQKMGTRNLAS